MIHKHFKGSYYLKLFKVIDANNNRGKCDVIYISLNLSNIFKLYSRNEWAFNLKFRKLTFKEHLYFIFNKKKIK